MGKGIYVFGKRYIRFWEKVYTFLGKGIYVFGKRYKNCVLYGSYMVGCLFCIVSEHVETRRAPLRPAIVETHGVRLRDIIHNDFSLHFHCIM